MTTEKYTMEFLWWFHLVGFFSTADMERKLIELGATEKVAMCLTMNEAAKKADVLAWWFYFCCDHSAVGGKPDPELENAAKGYIAYYHAQWQKLESKKGLTS